MLTPYAPTVWCWSVVRHAIIDERRRQRRLRRETTASDAYDMQLNSLIATQDFSNAEMRMFLATLPAYERNVLYLIYIFGYSQREISKRLGIPHQQVSRLHKKAIQTLREK